MDSKSKARRLAPSRPTFTAATWLVAGFLLALAWPLTLAAQGPALGYPRRIADGSAAQVIVSDPALGGIAALDKQTLAIAWTYLIAGDPLAVAACRNLVLIGNAATHSVEVYRVTKQGKKVEYLYNLGDPQTSFIKLPSDIATDAEFQLAFVLDAAERTIKVFAVTGSFLYSLPAAGEPSPLSPTAIAVDPGRQEVLVSDYGDPGGSLLGGATVPARVLIYTYAGKYLGMIDGRDRFGRPQGLAVDGWGRIYMAEALLGQVFVIDRSTGNVVNKLGSFGEAPGQLQLPLDVVLDQRSGDLFVTNNMLQRVEVFRGAGRLP